ncbi:hypothetical protein DP939_02570 [Spongiactinospora rosea]|uniref:Uncharacterized protein n=1 Tax=Spongiactinospora rosea TaxID=2248750 RepID=A0A366M708_9ACTN|nr:hypothetical protein DP939_02570 [Spongiactinospora rosea]
MERWDADAVGWVRRRSGLAAPEGHVFHELKVPSYRTTEHLGNAILSAGWTRILNLLIGTGSTQAMDATHTRVGVGDGTTAVTTADTTLTGSTNKYFKTAAGVGTIGAGAGPPTTTLTIAATFGISQANFDWRKFGVDFGTADGTTEVAPLLNAAVSNQGTKASGQIWTATATLSWT